MILSDLLLLQFLQIDKLVIQPAELHEGLTISLLCHHAVLEHKDAIGA